MKNLDWKLLKSEYLFRRPWLTARRDTCQLPDGRIHDEYYVLEYPTWVHVVAITKERENSKAPKTNTYTTKEGDTLYSIVKLADDKMYEVKKLKKNARKSERI